MSRYREKEKAPGITLIRLLKQESGMRKLSYKMTAPIPPVNEIKTKEEQKP